MGETKKFTVLRRRTPPSSSSTSMTRELNFFHLYLPPAASPTAIMQGNDIHRHQHISQRGDTSTSCLIHSTIPPSLFSTKKSLRLVSSTGQSAHKMSHKPPLLGAQQNDRLVLEWSRPSLRLGRLCVPIQPLRCSCHFTKFRFASVRFCTSLFIFFLHFCKQTRWRYLVIM